MRNKKAAPKKVTRRQLRAEAREMVSRLVENLERRRPDWFLLHVDADYLASLAEDYMECRP